MSLWATGCSGVAAAGTDTCAAGGMQDSSCCAARESDAAGAGGQSASQQLLQYGGPGRYCSSNGVLTSEAELLQYGDALRQQGNGMSSSATSAAAVSSAESSRTMCGVGRSHTRLAADSSCSSTDVLLHPPAASLPWNRTSSLSFNSSNGLSLANNDSGSGLCGPCLDGRGEVIAPSSGAVPRSSSSSSNGASVARSNRNNISFSSSSKSSEHCGSGGNTTTSFTRSSSTCGVAGGIGISTAGGSSSADLLMRPGVSYYGGRQAWVAEIKYGGRRRFKVFSVAKYGYEGAKQMAAATREQWEAAREAGQLDQLMRSSQRHQCPVQSGVKGVYYDTARKGWRVVVTLNCRQMSKFFLASKFGNAEAKRLAIECRQMWLDAIRNGRADDVFEKARRLVSFKMKTSPPQLTSHSKLLSLSPAHKPMPSALSLSPPLTHCGNHATTTAVASLTTTNGLPPPSTLSGVTTGGAALSNAAAVVANATLSQKATAAAVAGAAHVLLPPLVAAAVVSAPGAASSVSGIRNRISTFLMKSPAAATETDSPSRVHDKTGNAEEPLFSDAAAAAAARVAAAVAGVAAGQAQAASPAAAEAVGFRDGCRSEVAAGGMLAAATGLSLAMMTQDGCAGMHAPAAEQRAISAETAGQQAALGDAAWLRGSNRSNNNVYETASQQQQHPSVLVHPLPTSCNELMLSNNSSDTTTACSSSGNGSSHGGIGSGSSSISSIQTRSESALDSAKGSPDPTLTSFVACLAEDAGLHVPQEEKQQDTQASHLRGKHASCIGISCTTAASAAAIKQRAPHTQKAAGETQKAAAGIESTIASAARAVPEEASIHASESAQQFACGEATGEEAGKLVKSYATPAPGNAVQQQQQNQMKVPLGVTAGNVLSMRNAVVSQSFETTEEEGPLRQQKQRDDASGEESKSAAATPGQSPAVAAAGEVKAGKLAATAAVHGVAAGSAEGTGGHGALAQSAASTTTAVEGSAAAATTEGGGDLGTAEQAIRESGMKEIETLPPTAAGAPSGSPACGQSAVLFPHDVQAGISNNRQLHQHLQLQLLQDLRGSSFPLLDALWPSAAGSAPPVGSLAPNVTPDPSLRGRVTGFSNCGAAAAAGKGKQGEGGSMLLPSIASGCLSGGNSYEVQNLPPAAAGFVAHGKAADAVAMPDSSVAATVAEKARASCGELPRGANVLSSLSQQPRAQLSRQQQQQFFAAGAAASASRSSAVLNTGDSGEGGRNRTDSTTQTACEAAAAPAAGPSEICCRFPEGLASAAAAAALGPSSPWFLSSSQFCFVPGAAGAATTSTTAAEDAARCFLPVIGNVSNRAPLAGGSNTRRRGGGGPGGTVVTAAGAAPLSIQSRQPQIPQNAAAAAASPLAAAAASRGRPPQQRQSKDGSGVAVAAAATAAGESSSTCDVRGVYLDTRNNAWAATMGVHGRNVKKSFAVAKHGYETALQLAIHARRQLERVYWGENPPGSNSSSNAPTPPSNSPSQPSSCLRITPVPITVAGSVATSGAAVTEGDEGDKNVCFAAGSPSNSTPSAASALQLQRLQQQQQRLQQQFKQQVSATGGQSLPAALSPPSLCIFGPRRDAALGPAGFTAAVMGGTSAAAAAGLVSAAAASLQQQLRCAAALQQQQQAHNARAHRRAGLSLTQHQLCGWNSSPHALESATEVKGFYNSAGCGSSELAAAAGLGNLLLNPGNNVETGGMLAEEPTTRDSVATVNSNAGLPDAAAAPVATGGGAEVGRATAEAAGRLAAASAILYPSLSTAPSAAPASHAITYRGCDSSSLPGAPVDGGGDVTHGVQEGYKTSAGGRLQHGRSGPNPCSNAGAPTGDTSAASLLLGSAQAGARSNAGGTGGLLLGTVQGLAAAGGYEGAAENIPGLNPTLLLNGYGVGAGPSGLVGGRGVEARRAAAAGAAAASFLEGAGGLLLGSGGGIAALLCGGRGSALAGEPGAIAAPSEGPAGESCFMMQDALTALLLQLEPRQRNDLLRGCPPHALLAAAGAAAGVAAAASQGEKNTPSLPVLLQQQYLHNSVGAHHRLLLQQAVASGASATGLLLEQQQQQIHYEQSLQEHSFDQHARQQQLLQQHPTQEQQHQRMECMRENLQNNGNASGRPIDGGGQQLRTSSIDGRDAESSSTSLLPYDHSHQHAGIEEGAASTETAIPLYVSAGQSSTAELWQSHQHSSRVCEEVKPETVHQPQQEAGGGCASAVGTTEGLAAGTAGMINITRSLEDTAIRGNSSSNSFSSGTACAAGSNFPMTVPANPLSLRQEPAPNNGQSCSSMQQPCVSGSNAEREANTAKGEEDNSPYTWNGGVTLLETGLTLAAADVATTKDQQQQQPPTVASTYNGHAAAAASCVSLVAEDNRRT